MVTLLITHEPPSSCQFITRWFMTHAGFDMQSRAILSTRTKSKSCKINSFAVVFRGWGLASGVIHVHQNLLDYLMVSYLICYLNLILAYLTLSYLLL